MIAPRISGQAGWRCFLCLGGDLSSCPAGVGRHCREDRERSKEINKPPESPLDVWTESDLSFPSQGWLYLIGNGLQRGKDVPGLRKDINSETPVVILVVPKSSAWSVFPSLKWGPHKHRCALLTALHFSAVTTGWPHITQKSKQAQKDEVTCSRSGSE